MHCWAIGGRIRIAGEAGIVTRGLRKLAVRCRIRLSIALLSPLLALTFAPALAVCWRRWRGRLCRFRCHACRRVPRTMPVVEATVADMRLRTRGPLCASVVLVLVTNGLALTVVGVVTVGNKVLAPPGTFVTRFRVHRWRRRSPSWLSWASVLYNSLQGCRSVHDIGDCPYRCITVDIAACLGYPSPYEQRGLGEVVGPPRAVLDHHGEGAIPGTTGIEGSGATDCLCSTMTTNKGQAMAGDPLEAGSDISLVKVEPDNLAVGAMELLDGIAICLQHA